MENCAKNRNQKSLRKPSLENLQLKTTLEIVVRKFLGFPCDTCHVHSETHGWFIATWDIRKSSMGWSHYVAMRPFNEIAQNYNLIIYIYVLEINIKISLKRTHQMVIILSHWRFSHEMDQRKILQQFFCKKKNEKKGLFIIQ